MRVRGTGGTGFVGSHTVAALCAGGHHVKLLVRDPARMAPALAPHGLADLDYEVGDVTDAAAVARARGPPVDAFRRSRRASTRRAPFPIILVRGGRIEHS